MFSQRKICLFVALFSFILLYYLIFLSLFPESSLTKTPYIFESFSANYIFIVLCSMGLSALIYCAYLKLLKLSRRRPKIGEILVAKGYITEWELEEALSEQRPRIGEVLLQARRITSQQLNQALDQQNKISKKLRLLRDFARRRWLLRFS